MNQKPHNQVPTSERGQSMIEFAISLVVVLILLAGIFDAARALFTYLSLRDAAQEGALYASIDPTNTTEIVARACNASNLLADLCDENDPRDMTGFEITVLPTVPGGGHMCMGATSGQAHGVRVTINYPDFPLTMPLIGEMISSSNTVRITASIQDTIITPSCP